MNRVNLMNTIELRSYQRELARHAIEGENTIICSPTGSRKTIVAVEIIQNHLETRGINRVNISRVAFLVPTIPLVEQQCKVIDGYSGAKYKIQGFSGSADNRVNLRAIKILDNHVVVITPKMLVDLLQRVDKNSKLYITDFTLFVLDECHHCVAKHPYEIMMKLVRQYIEETINRNSQREIPQIVGLSASIGSDYKAILSLCARMCATQLSSVYSDQGIEEMKLYINPPEDEIYHCQRHPKDDFRAVVHAMMLKIVEDLKDKFVMIERHVEPLTKFKFPDVQNLSFALIINNLKASKKSWPDYLEEYKRFVAEACDHLLAYASVIQMNDLLPASIVFEFMENKFAKLFEEEVSGFFTKIYEDNIDKLKFLQARKDCDASKEILDKLKSIIQQAYSVNSNTRTLIFVETRTMTTLLSKYLNASETFKKFAHRGENFAAYLTSTNAARKGGGLSPSEQKEVLAKFSTGQIKVLVVTTVAEEGLDISACNLIIKYNNIGTELSLIQRRGRARQLDSKCILICLDECVKQRELENIDRELKMNACLKDLQSKSSAELKALIEKECKLLL